MMVCPFGAIHVVTTTIGERRKRAALKCDLCIERPDGPACVDACPTGALSVRYPEKVAELSTRASARQYLEALTVKDQLSVDK